MKERKVQVYVHNKSYRMVLRDEKYNYVIIKAQTSKPTPKSGQMRIKEFHAQIYGSENSGFRADFTTPELVWKDNKLIYEPI